MTASNRAIQASQEPYCEIITIVFTFGPKRETHVVKIPIDCFNIEVDGPQFIIPKLFPSKIARILNVNLPDGDIPWIEGVKQFMKYLMPLHKNNKRVTTSPVIPLSLTPAVLLPLFLICKRMHMNRLAMAVAKEIEQLHCSQAVIVVQQIVKAGVPDVGFMELLLDKLANALPTIRAQTFGGIEMASVIVSLLHRAKPEKDPSPIVDWLHVVFPKFAEQMAFKDKIEEIFSLLKCDEPNTAFVAWCYSAFLESIPGVELFGKFISGFVLQKVEMTYVLPAPMVIWLLQNIDPEKNKRAMIQVVCRWLRTNHSEGKTELFAHAIENKLLNFELIDGSDLCVLLPFAYHYDIECFRQVVHEMKLNLRKWRVAVTSKSVELNSLPWRELVSAFVLTQEPKPAERMSNLVTEMRLNYKQIDSILYKWIISHREDVTLDVLGTYFSFPTTELSHQKRQHRRLILIDILNRLGEPASGLKELTLMEFSTFVDFSSVLTGLLRKKNVVLHEKTISYLHENCRDRPSLMIQFVELITRVPDLNVLDWLLPVNELNVITCLEILSRTPDPPIAVRDNILAITRLVLSSLRKCDLDRVIGLFSVEDIFGSFGRQFVFVNDEDLPLYFALKRNEIDVSSGCPEFLRFPHVSLRALSRVTDDPRLKKPFQFEVEEQSILADIPTMSDLPLKWWCRCDIPPRPGTYPNLAAAPPSKAYVYIFAEQTREMDEQVSSMLRFLGLPTMVNITEKVSEFAWTYVTQYTKFRTGYDVYILYMPSGVAYDVDFWTLLDGIMAAGPGIPLVVSATAALKMQQFYRSTWETIVGKQTQLMCYDVSEDDRHMRWNEPSPTLLPRKQDLMKGTLSLSGKDTFYGSIPFSGGAGQDWTSVMEWNNGRVFAGSISGTSTSVFNFELITPHELVDPLDIWIRSKQVALCLLSLMCESIAGVAPVFVNATHQ